jgi:hypothetical protein
MLTKDIADVLIDARALLARPGGWCQGVYAKDKDGMMTHSFSLSAQSLCLDAAIHRSSGETGLYQKSTDFVENLIGRGATCVAFNDASGRRKHDVLALLDRAIAKARGKGLRNQEGK